MKTTFQSIAIAAAACLSLGLAVSAAGAQDRPAGPGGGAQAQGPQTKGDWARRGPRGADREKLFAEMKQRRQQRLHDLLQIRSDQEGAFRTFLAALEQARPQRTPGQDRRRPGGPGHPGSGPQEGLTTPERLDRMNQRIAERQQRAQKTTAAVKTFYAVLTAEQRKAFDELPILKVGERHRGGPGFGGPGGHWGGRMMRGPFRGPPPGPAR